jgi:hypothetical protein
VALVEAVQDDSLAALVGGGRKLQLKASRIKIDSVDFPYPKKPSENNSDVTSKPVDPPELYLYEEEETGGKMVSTKRESPEHHPVTVDIDIDIDMKPNEREGTPELFDSGSSWCEGEEKTKNTEKEPQKDMEVRSSTRLTGAKKRKSQKARKLKCDEASVNSVSSFDVHEQQLRVTVKDKIVPLVSTSKVYHAKNEVPDLVKALGNNAVRAYECNWLCCPPGVDPKDYAKVVGLMLDDYRLQLNEVQRKMLTMPAKWGKEIEEGDTEGRTLDKKVIASSGSETGLISERLRMRHSMTSMTATAHSASTGSAFLTDSGTSSGRFRNSPLSNHYPSLRSTRQPYKGTALSSRESQQHNLTEGIHLKERNIQQHFLSLKQTSADASKSTSVQSGILSKDERYSPRREAKPVLSAKTSVTVSKLCKTDSRFEFNSSDSTSDDDDDDFVVTKRKPQRNKFGSLHSGTGTSQVVNDGSTTGRQQTERGTIGSTLKRKNLCPDRPQLKRVKQMTLSDDEKPSETKVDGVISSASGWMCTRTDKTSDQRVCFHLFKLSGSLIL